MDKNSPQNKKCVILLKKWLSGKRLLVAEERTLQTYLLLVIAEESEHICDALKGNVDA